jgi:hypothetical protein
MPRSFGSGMALLRALLCAILMSNLACQTTSRGVDPKAVTQPRPYTDPQERPHNGPGEGWILLRRLTM